MPEGSLFSGLLERFRSQPSVLKEMKQISGLMPEWGGDQEIGLIISNMQRANKLLEQRYGDVAKIKSVSGSDVDLIREYAKIVSKGALEMLTPAANIQSLKWLLSFVNKKNELIKDGDVGQGIKLSVVSAMGKLENVDAEQKLITAVAVTKPHPEMFLLMAEAMPSLDDGYQETFGNASDKLAQFPLKIMLEWLSETGGAIEIGKNRPVLGKLCEVASRSHFMDLNTKKGYLEVLAKLMKKNTSLTGSDLMMDALNSVVENIVAVPGADLTECLQSLRSLPHGVNDQWRAFVNNLQTRT